MVAFRGVYVSGLQPSGFVADLTQPFGLGWDVSGLRPLWCGGGGGGVGGGLGGGGVVGAAFRVRGWVRGLEPTHAEAHELDIHRGSMCRAFSPRVLWRA